MTKLAIDTEALKAAMLVGNKEIGSIRTKVRLRQAKELQIQLGHKYVRDGEDVGCRFNGFLMGLPRKIRKKYKACCFYCGEELDSVTKSRDHMFPRAEGGRVTVPACLECNGRKGRYTLSMFRVAELGDVGQKFWGEIVMERAHW